MSDSNRSRSPLARFGRPAGPAAFADATFAAIERPFLGHLNLRGKPEDTRFREAVKSTLGLDLPVVPNTVAEAGAVVVCWLGPDEWLVITPGDREDAVAQALREATSGLFVSVTVLSGGQTVLVLEGPRVPEVLARGCTLDLHPLVFGTGRCAQSQFGKAPMLLRRVDDTPRFEMVVRRSFADYAWTYLLDAAAVDAPAAAAPAA